MKIFIRNIGLALLALFCFKEAPSQTLPRKEGLKSSSPVGEVRRGQEQVDTSKFIQFQRIDEDSLKVERARALKALKQSFSNGKSYYLNRVDTSKLARIQKQYDLNTNDTFYFAEVDSAHVGVLDADLAWVIEPSYCAIAEYDPELELVSARACPFSHSYKKMKYWDKEPAFGNWGVADTSGGWIIDPVFEEPIVLNQSWQMAMSYEKGGLVAFVGLEEKWPGEYNMIAPFGDEAFIIRKGRETGLRWHNGEWLIGLKAFQLIKTDEYLILLDSIEVIKSGKLTLSKVNSDYTIDEIKGASNSLSLLSEVSIYVEQAGEHIKVVNEGISNPDYLIEDSVFATWFVLEYWSSLFGTSYDNLHRNIYVEGSIDDVFADTVYTNKPHNWYPYERTEESDSWFNILQNGKATYSILQQEYSVNYGSYGPAYENMDYSMANVHVVNEKCFELKLGDCFKHRDSTVLKDYFKLTIPDSFNIYWEHIVLNEAFWQVKEDSLIFFFPSNAGGRGYSEFEYDYRRYALSKKELGRRFLNERRRKRQLLKAMN